MRYLCRLKDPGFTLGLNVTPAYIQVNKINKPLKPAQRKRVSCASESVVQRPLPAADSRSGAIRQWLDTADLGYAEALGFPAERCQGRPDTVCGRDLDGWRDRTGLSSLYL